MKPGPISLEEFTKQLLGHAGSFRVRMERALVRHPGMYQERRSFPDWFNDFLRFARDERRQMLMREEAKKR